MALLIAHEGVRNMRGSAPRVSVHRFAKISHFTQKKMVAENFAFFVHLIHSQKSENFAFFCKISLKSVSRKKAKF